MTQTGAEPQQRQARDWPRTIRRLALVAAALVGGFFLVRYLGGMLPLFSEWVKGLGPWGPLVFILGYIVSVVAVLPAVVLTVSAGVIFGLIGTLYVWIGATIGSICSFLIARHFARRRIEPRIQSDPRFAAIDRAVAAEGFKIVFLMRLSPAFPFVFINYALGLTRVSLSQYALAAFGMIPGSLMYVYFGYVAGDVAAVTGGAVAHGTEYYVLRGVGLLATVVVTVLVTRIAARALREAKVQ
jgi:uncharacterized membrane protein YdjX (TVP38/TMEM64 family)